MSSYEPYYRWKLDDDQSLSLYPKSGRLELSPAFASHFNFVYRDPRKLAEVLRNIADILLKCQEFVIHDDTEKPCDKPATVFTKYEQNNDSYGPAQALCDEHFKEKEDWRLRLEQLRSESNTEQSPHF